VCVCVCVCMGGLKVPTHCIFHVLFVENSAKVTFFLLKHDKKVF